MIQQNWFWVLVLGSLSVRLDPGSSCSVLGLQEQLLVEGLVLVAPFVAAAPAGGASIQEACACPSGFKGEVQQVIQADLFGSCKLSRAELGPARLCYLRRDRERRGDVDAARYALYRLGRGPRTHLLTSSSACDSILSPASLSGSLVKILAFLWVGAAGARESVTFGEGGLALAAVALGASIILTV